ncbi:MAG: 23S rRNA (adenine(2503)-C(2))-methyltransferase RlmN [Armatimonadota bacterium]
MKINLKKLNIDELKDFFSSIGEKPYRAKQVFKWIYTKGVDSFEEMTDLGKSLKDKLSKSATISKLKLLEKKTSSNNDTEKYLFELEDGELVEAVLMRYEEDLGFGRVTLCISTQVGCSLDCSFCATGKSGFIRDLTFYEIADQVLQIQKIIKDTHDRIANIVVMGMGEPFLNYDNVMKAVRILNDPDGLCIGARHITISTCGIIPGILKLAEEEMQVKLAISLHTADNEKRTELMSINKKYPLKDLMYAIKTYQEKTKRRVTFEYVLIKGFNDSQNDIKKLVELTGGIKCIVNIIPVNNTGDKKFELPAPKDINRVRQLMEDAGLNVTVRKSRGGDIEGACGQLKAKREKSR